MQGYPFLARTPNPSSTWAWVIGSVAVAAVGIPVGIWAYRRRRYGCPPQVWVSGADTPHPSLQAVPDPGNPSLLTVDEVVALEDGDLVTQVYETSPREVAYVDLPVRWDIRQRDDGYWLAELSHRYPCRLPRGVTVVGPLIPAEVGTEYQPTLEEAKRWRATRDIARSTRVFRLGFRGPLVAPQYPSDLE